MKVVQIPEQSFEVGFRYIKSVRLGEEVCTYQSIIKDYPVGRKPPTVDMRNGNTLVQYIKPNSSINDKLAGRLWYVGSKARSLNGARAATSFTDKAELAVRFAMVALCPDKSGATSIEIENLHTSLPVNGEFDDVLVQRIKEALEGTHVFLRNGKKIEATVGNVQVSPEGYGSYLTVANHHPELLAESGYTGILDLGGKTANLVLVDPDGDYIPDATYSFETGGTYSLALAISNEYRLKHSCRGALDLNLFMDAIASQSLIYGAKRSFAGEYEYCLKAWFDGILGEIESRWQTYLSQIGKILVTGGSAALVDPFLADSEGLMSIVPNFQTASCQGLISPNPFVLSKAA